jgi:hypothetical protein
MSRGAFLCISPIISLLATLTDVPASAALVQVVASPTTLHMAGILGQLLTATSLQGGSRPADRSLPTLSFDELPLTFTLDRNLPGLSTPALEAGMILVVGLTCGMSRAAGFLTPVISEKLNSSDQATQIPGCNSGPGRLAPPSLPRLRGGRRS